MMLVTTVVLVWVFGSMLVAWGLGRAFRKAEQARIEAAKRGKWVVYYGKRQAAQRPTVHRRAN